jgi:hypothetical protein
MLFGWSNHAEWDENKKVDVFMYLEKFLLVELFVNDDVKNEKTDL